MWGLREKYKEMFILSLLFVFELIISFLSGDFYVYLMGYGRDDMYVCIIYRYIKYWYI